MSQPSQIVRVLANFTRLFTGFAIGLILIRLLLGLGQEVYGVIAVLTAGVGMAEMLRGMLRMAIVPQLGQALHGEDPQRFERAYNSALVLSAGCGLLTLPGFLGLSLALSWLDIPPALFGAARIFIWLAALQSLVCIVTDPVLNLLIVTERMVAYNLSLIATRLAQLFAAIGTLVFFSERGPETVLIGYGVLLAAGNLTLALAISTGLIVANRRFRPRPGLASRAEIRSVLGYFGWNAIYVVALNLHGRLNIVISNVVFGLAAGMLYSIAFQLSSYIGQLSQGLVLGLDAVSARKSRQAVSDLARLATHQMLLQSMVILPATAGVLLATEDIIRVWIGNRLEDPQRAIPSIALLCGFLVTGVAAQSLSEGWMKILAGAGRVRAYSPFVLAGGMLNPALIALLLVFLPESQRHLAPAYTFCAIFVFVHAVALPMIASRFLGCSVFHLYRPCAGPLLCLALALGAARVFRDGVPPFLGLPGLFWIFCGVYGVAVSCFAAILLLPRRRGRN